MRLSLPKGEFMKKFAVLVVLLGVFVSYQNCSPGNGLSQSSPAELTTQTPTSYNQVSVQSSPSLSVWDSSHGQFLDVDLLSGKISAFVDGGQSAGGNYCLTPALQQSLQQILSGAQICIPVVDPQQYASQVCAMVYAEPYASLVGSDSKQYNLGEKNDSCEIPVDLCGSASGALKAWSASLISQLQNLNCQ